MLHTIHPLSNSTIVNRRLVPDANFAAVLFFPTTTDDPRHHCTTPLQYCTTIRFAHLPLVIGASSPSAMSCRPILPVNDPMQRGAPAALREKLLVPHGP